MAANTISIADFARQKRTFTVSSEIGDYQVTYRPYQMTPAREAEIVRMSSEEFEDEMDEDIKDTEKGLSKIVLQFCEIIEAISLVGPLYERVNPRTGEGEGRCIVKKDEPIAVIPENVRFFSNVFILSTLQEVMKDSRPKSKKRQENLQDI